MRRGKAARDNRQKQSERRNVVISASPRRLVRPVVKRQRVVTETPRPNELIVACFTAGDYARVAQDYLLPSLSTLGLPHVVREMKDKGSWVRNGYACQEFILEMHNEHPEADLLFLDVDAVVHTTPWPLLRSLKCDVAAHLFGGKEMLTGTLYLPAGPRRLELLTRWVDRNKRVKKWDQQNLQDMLKEDPTLCFAELPAEYCCIFDLQRKRTPNIVPVIEHFQASRQYRKGSSVQTVEEKVPRLLSILIPMYNVGRFLDRCLQSIVSQTWQDWEAILVDDGSQDNTVAVADIWEKRDSRIRCYPCNHRGHSITFNACLEHARGEFIGRQDADDWSDPSRFSRQIELLDRYGADICSTLMQRVFVADNGDIEKAVLGSSVGGTGMEPLAFCSTTGSKGPAAGTLVARRGVYDRLGGYAVKTRSQRKGSSDSDWLFRALVLDNPPLRWSHVHEELYYYRDHPDQTMKKYRQVLERDHARFRSQYAPSILARLRKEQIDANTTCKHPIPSVLLQTVSKPDDSIHAGSNVEGMGVAAG